MALLVPAHSHMSIRAACIVTEQTSWTGGRISYPGGTPPFGRRYARPLCATAKMTRSATMTTSGFALKVCTACR